MSRRLRNPEFAGWLLLGGAIAVAAALVFWLERDGTYAFDELPWVEIGGLSPLEQFWHPYGGHLIVVPYYVFRATLELFGNSFTAFSVIQVVGLSAMGALLYVYGRRRVGPILALGPAIVLLFLGGSYPVLLEPLIGIQFLAALVPGLAAIVVLEREDLPGDIAACALLTLSVAGFSQGLIFLAGAVVAVALSPNWKRRVWVLAVPILAYGYWRHYASQFDEPSGIVGSNIPLLLAYFVDALAVFSTAIFGMVGFVGPGPWTLLRLNGFAFNYVAEGVVYLVFELLAVVAAVWALRRRVGAIPRSLWPALAMLAVLFVELGVILIPGRTAAEPRYLYAGVLLVMMVGLELARGVRTTRVSIVVMLALTAAALAGNAARFQDARELLDDYQHHARADMAVIELAGKKGDQAFTPNVEMPGVISGAFQLNSGPWLLVAERYGSPSYSLAQLRAQSDQVRAEADLVAARSLHLWLEPVSSAPASGCRTLTGSAAAAGFELPRGGVVLRPNDYSAVALGRWADGFPIDLGALGGGQAAALAIPTDASGEPWSMRLLGSRGAEICPTG
ncbi:MAG: hypothetical protein JJE35_01400 [Thermoleophilia bacterium]|nr:hypothetical protein [Thermoleophilia bacterium]